MSDLEKAIAYERLVELDPADIRAWHVEHREDWREYRRAWKRVRDEAEAEADTILREAGA